jgi:hypothetical protein
MYSNRLAVCGTWHDCRRPRNNLASVSSCRAPILSYRLTTIDRPSTVGVAYSSNANLVTKSPLIGAYCPSCCCSDSESRPRCRSSRSSVATNTDATLTISLPSATPLPLWCDVPMNITPYVDSLIERCSARAPWRAASESMSAYGCQSSVLPKIGKAHSRF